MVNCFQQPCLAAIIIYYTVADMTDRTYGENDIYRGIELEQSVQHGIERGDCFIDAHHMFVEPSRGCAMAIRNRSRSFKEPVRK